MSDYQKIMNYLDNHPEGISNMEAYSVLRTTKLSTRLGELNASGKYMTDSVWETHTNQDGETKRYKRYFKRAV